MILWELLSLLALLVLRIGLPLALIGLLTWWLTRLDRRWQAEPIAPPTIPDYATTGSASKDATSAGNRPLIQVPCWVFRACPPERCAKCRVYQSADRSLPCWRMHLASDGRLPAGCRTCAIFATTLPAAAVSAAGAD